MLADNAVNDAAVNHHIITALDADALPGAGNVAIRHNHIFAASVGQEPIAAPAVGAGSDRRGRTDNTAVHHIHASCRQRADRRIAERQQITVIQADILFAAGAVERASVVVAVRVGIGSIAAQGAATDENVGLADDVKNLFVGGHLFDLGATHQDRLAGAQGDGTGDPVNLFPTAKLDRQRRIDRFLQRRRVIRAAVANRPEMLGGGDQVQRVIDRHRRGAGTGVRERDIGRRGARISGHVVTLPA